MKHSVVSRSVRPFRMAALLFFLLFYLVQSFAKPGFAIVIDPKSYQEAQTEIEQYVRALQDIQGFKVYIVQDVWGTPHGIKAELARLHALKKEAVVGAVFVGDIPIPMLRDAQRLTSAFKMNQNQDWKESSVPSDRYYEDFGMDFRFLKKDEQAPYFYYSLSPVSRQYLQCDIFSGRIRPTDIGGVSRYEKLRRYLRKATEWKRNRTEMRRMLFFSGHGYVSESLVTRLDEQLNLYDHFPQMRLPGHDIRYMDYRQQRNTKVALMNELQRRDLDLALLHHHGAPDTQYLDATDRPASAEEAQRLIKNYGRGYLRKQVGRGQPKDSVLAALSLRFDVPTRWFDNAFDPRVAFADSVEAADKDLTLADFSRYNYRPNCRLVVLDACFNGSFHLDDCIANEYIFNDGRTIACIANTVNVLQDKWADKYIGLMGQGLYAGNLARLSGFLENHCIGDPTFTFAQQSVKVDVNTLVDTDNESLLHRLLKGAPSVDVASLAMQRLFERGKLSSARLLEIFTESSSPLLRLQALHLLAQYRNDDFISVIAKAVNDDNEAVERTALNYLGKSGDTRLIPVLADKLLDLNTSPRCAFSIINALSFYSSTVLLPAFDSAFATKAPYYVERDKLKARLEGVIKANADKWQEGIVTILDEQAPLKKRLSAIRTTRNYCPHASIPSLIACAETTREDAVKVALLESLGWRYHSVYVPQILAFAKRCIENSTLSTAAKEEAQRVINALEKS